MKAGTYYVGDPCYVLDATFDFDWMEILLATGYFGIYHPGTEDKMDPDENDGYFEIDGVRIFASSTDHGDGAYLDNSEREYGVDAGLIACIPVELLGGEEAVEKAVFGLANIVEFEHDFSCETVDEDGTIHIGDIEVYTGFEDEDEDATEDAPSEGP